VVYKCRQNDSLSDSEIRNKHQITAFKPDIKLRGCEGDRGASAPVK
jgi:hypothetical protein